jgi:hypothetical protein
LYILQGDLGFIFNPLKKTRPPPPPIFQKTALLLPNNLSLFSNNLPLSHNNMPLSGNKDGLILHKLLFILPLLPVGFSKIFEDMLL